MTLPSIPIGLLTLGQADAGGAAAAAVEIQSVWDFVVKGGPMMIPIAACSLVAAAVVTERLLSLRRSNVIPSGFLSGLQEQLGSGNGNGNRQQALEYCERSKSPVAAVFAAGIKRLDEPVEVVERHIQEAGERLVVSLRKFLRILSTIASISPLMGLLGTIFGMIKAFQTVAVSGQALGKTELLAKGIYEAMITTAGGLLVCIPVLVCYNYISARIDRLVLDIDQMTCDFVEEYARGGNAVEANGERDASADADVSVGEAA